jgi:hypothetical protein
MQVQSIKQIAQNRKIYSSNNNVDCNIVQNAEFMDNFQTSKNSNKNINFKGQQFKTGYFTDEEIRLAKKYLHVEDYLDMMTDEVWGSFGALSKLFSNKSVRSQYDSTVNSVNKLINEFKEDIAERSRRAKRVADDLADKERQTERLRKEQEELKKQIKLQKLKERRDQLDLGRKKIDLMEENMSFERELIQDQKLSDYTGDLKSKFIDLVQMEKNEQKAGLDEKSRQKLLFPNGIMLSGLDKKTSDEIIQWTFKKTGCKVKKIDFKNLTEAEAIQQLNDIAEKALTTKTRTLIHIQNFEKFTEQNATNKEIIPKLKGFLSNCAEKYKCTVITEVEDASKLAPEITAPQRFKVKITDDIL